MSYHTWFTSYYFLNIYIVEIKICWSYRFLTYSIIPTFLYGQQKEIDNVIHHYVDLDSTLNGNLVYIIYIILYIIHIIILYLLHTKT